MFLQKAHDAKRIYATVVNAKTNCDGFKDTGIAHPSGEMQSLLVRQCCEECGVDPSSVEYCEAHGTATKVCSIQDQIKVSFLHIISYYVLIVWAVCGFTSRHQRVLNSFLSQICVQVFCAEIKASAWRKQHPSPPAQVDL
jgi:hypothetical protein